MTNHKPRSRAFNFALLYLESIGKGDGLSVKSKEDYRATYSMPHTPEVMEVCWGGRSGQSLVKVAIVELGAKRPPADFYVQTDEGHNVLAQDIGTIIRQAYDEFRKRSGYSIPYESRYSLPLRTLGLPNGGKGTMYWATNWVKGLKFAGDFDKAWEKPGGGMRSVMQPAEAADMATKFTAYMDSVVMAHPYLSMLSMAPEHPSPVGTSIGISLRYSSDNLAFSKSLKREVIADVVMYMRLEDPPAWMKKSMGWSDEDEARAGFRMIHSRVQYFDPDTGKRIAEMMTSKPTSNATEALKEAVSFLQSDLIIGWDGEEAQDDTAPVAPTVREPELVMAKGLYASLKQAALTDERVKWWSNYAANREFASEQEAREWVFGRLRSYDKQFGPAFGHEPEEKHRQEASEMPLYQKRGKWKVGKPIRKRTPRVRQTDFSVRRPDAYEVAQVAAANAVTNDYDIGRAPQWVPTRLLLGDDSGSIYQRGAEDAYIKELAGKIKQSLWIEAVIVGKLGDEMWVIEGQHRTRAMRYLGFASVPAIIVEFHEAPKPPVQAWLQSNCAFAAKSPVFILSPSMLFVNKGKAMEAMLENESGKGTQTKGPITVSELDSVPGGFFLIDGHHRAIEWAQSGLPIECVIAEHVPFIERPVAAYENMLRGMIPLSSII